MNRIQRPPWTTALLIPLAFGCGIASGVLIWRGGKKTKRTGRVEERLRRALEMNDSQNALASEGVLAKLQDAISRGVANKDRGSAKNHSPQSEKGDEHRGRTNGTANRPDYASTITSSVRSPGIRIEEEMVVPPRG